MCGIEQAQAAEQPGGGLAGKQLRDQGPGGPGGQR